MDSISNYIQGLQNTLNTLPVATIAEAIDVLHHARISNQQVFIMGNGGSASTASHFVCDLGKNTQKEGWPHFRVLGLADNMATLSAYANDEGYEQVFARQLSAFLQPDDVVIAISASGNSPNVLNAIKLARTMNARTIGFTGFNGGQLARLVELNVHVDSNCIEQVEDIHLALEHLICTALRDCMTAVN